MILFSFELFKLQDQFYGIYIFPVVYNLLLEKALHHEITLAELVGRNLLNSQTYSEK